jgi:hypothetical protein
VLLSQNLNGSADNVSFTLGNADRVMTQLANNTDLKYAQIDLCLFHQNSGILLQLWSGFIQKFTSDGSPLFAVQCSDGLYQMTLAYPTRSVSFTCWKMFDDGKNCPFATASTGPDAGFTADDPLSCDYYYNSTCDPTKGTNPDGTLVQPGGCQAHGMDRYFGGHPAQPQTAYIKDNSTGIWGFGRNRITATSIVSDTVVGNALPEIWCNDEGDPGKTFMVNGLIIAGRYESDFYDALAIVGLGPLRAYCGMLVYTNADGHKYIIAPMLDGQPPQGFKVNSNLQITSDSSLGLRSRVPRPSAAGNADRRYLPIAPAARVAATPDLWRPPSQDQGCAATYCPYRAIHLQCGFLRILPRDQAGSDRQEPSDPL